MPDTNRRCCPPTCVCHDNRWCAEQVGTTSKLVFTLSMEVKIDDNLKRLVPDLSLGMMDALVHVGWDNQQPMV